MLKKLVQELKNCSCQINKLEKQAAAALAKGYDLELYHDLMRQKADLLGGLLDEVRGMVDELDERTAKYVVDRLGGFSHGAEKALALDSVFYMSALLYPENYRQGDKNDLDDFIDRLARGDF